ncbi:MAG: hypothetical protein ACKOEZ_11080, partial [Spartobacteria bacterium]
NASDPTTPPDILASLARSSGTSVRRAVAENPNTPVEGLNTLWNKFPEALLANPIVAFWELTEPAALQKNISPAACLAAYNHLRKKGAELAPHIHTAEALKKAMEHAFRQEDTKVFAHAPSDPVARVRLMFVKMAKDYSSSARFFYEKAPEAAWQSLSNDPDPAVRLGFAEWLRGISNQIEKPNSSFNQAARALAACNEEDVFLQLANCPPIPADVVQRLALSDSLEIRSALSKCTNTPPESLELLCKDPDESVRLAFAKNCRLAHAHTLLLGDPSLEVRKSLASNCRVARKILLQFDPNDHPSVLRNVFLNGHAGEELRSRIFTNADSDLKKVIAHSGFRLKPKFYFSHKNHIPHEVRSLLTERNGLHPQIAADLAVDPDPKIRIKIAYRLRGQYCWRDHDANLSLLELFATDADEGIREYVCTDSRLTLKQTEDLAKDAEPDVRIKVLAHIISRLEDFRNCNCLGSHAALYHETRHLFLEAAKDPSASVRLRLSYAKETPPEALGILFDDPDCEIRERARDHSHWPFGAVLDFEKAHPRFKGATRHGNTTPSLHVLHQFARSPNPFLRQLTARCSRTCASDLRLLAGDSHAV